MNNNMTDILYLRHLNYSFKLMYLLYLKGVRDIMHNIDIIFSSEAHHLGLEKFVFPPLIFLNYGE
jgi:hypothetical protein